MIGVRFGNRIGCAGFGLLGVVAATATTLGEAVAHLQRFEALTSTLGHMRIRRQRTELTLIWEAYREVAPAVAEAVIAGWISFGRWLLGDCVSVRDASFTHARSAALSNYEQGLICPVHFDAPETGITLSSDLLDARPHLADATLNAALGAWLDGCTPAANLDAGRPTTCNVARWLAQRPALDAVDEAVVARALNLTSRTLQRRLASERTRFGTLLDAARAQHSIVTLLDGTPSLANLSVDVGFQEQSSLSRAFRRWTGYAPLPLKKRLAHVYHDLRPQTWLILRPTRVFEVRYLPLFVAAHCWMTFYGR